jgi:hypothetical protein
MAPSGLRGAGIEADADSIQCAFFDGHRVALAHACNADDGRGDDFSYRVVSINKAKFDQRSLIGRRHRFNLVPLAVSR